MAEDKDELQKAYYRELARIGKAVANPNRLMLLDRLSSGPKTVEGLARLTGLTVANASQHLQRLKEARLVESEKNGLQVFYRLADPEVTRFYESLRTIAEKRLLALRSIIEQFRSRPDMLEDVKLDTLLERAKRGEVTVLDVRPREEYESGHLPGAVSVPLEKLVEKAAELPRDKEIVAYCRGSYCVLSKQAAEILKEEGFEAKLLPEGVEEWIEQGIELKCG